jgi:hypothetical protein
MSDYIFEVDLHGSRLLKGAALLIKNSKNPRSNKFDMCDWVVSKEEKPENSCGTTACAWGSMALSGIFEKEGVKVERVDAIFEIIYDIDNDLETYDNFEAAKKFFGLTEEEADYLFLPQYYPVKYRKGAGSERYVAQRIREFVAFKKKMNQVFDRGKENG